MAYKSAEVTLNEHAEDAQIAARLIKIYNGCLRWREVRAEDDVWNFLITSSLAMLSGYATVVEVMKQVSRRGSMRMPAFLTRGKCRRGLLSQFGVQREIRIERAPREEQQPGDVLPIVVGWW